MRPTGKILVIRSGAIGDFIVTLPVIHLLRKRYPTWRLGIVARSRVRSLVKGVADQFVDIDGSILVPFFQEKVDRDCEQYRYLNRFDLIISYLGRSGKVSENLNALTKVRVINADPLPPEKYGRHITEFLLEALTEIVDVSSPPLPTINIGKEEQRFARRFYSESGIARAAPVIAVHPGSGGRQKVSPAGNFCQAAKWILGKLPEAKILVTEGEADEQDVLAFQRGLKASCVKVKREDLLEIAAILSRASLFIGNDSGIAHLAAAVGVPTIAVFRASNAVVWAPRGKRVWVASDASLQHIVQTVTKGLVVPGSKQNVRYAAAPLAVPARDGNRSQPAMGSATRPDKGLSPRQGRR